MDAAPQFVHLHLHTHYSLLDGATRIGELMTRAKALDMPAVAITDHGNMFGVIEFYEAACKAGIKPIIGCELYIAHGSRLKKESAGRGKKSASHLLVLAMNETGYRNLTHLSTLGYTEGFYRKPRIDRELLREYSEGLICTSTCLAGEIPQALMADRHRQAEELAEAYLDIFTDQRFFIELQDHGIEEQRRINPELVDLARRLGVGLIASNDVHYLDHGDVEAHDVLCCINTGSKLTDEDRFRFQTDQFYFKTPKEMTDLFGQHPEALANTLRIAEMCNVEFDFSKRYTPVYSIPDDVTDTQTGQTLTDAEYLRRLVYQGAEERYGEITDELKERIEYELRVITSKGFASYFLIVWDFCNFARSHSIPIGARGSGCSSVVTYCLRISHPDPIRYGLYFERFMDPDRDEMPDIDADICQDGRSVLLDYVRKKYGHVAQIITFGTLKARAAIKDVARVMGIDFERANAITKLVPTDLKITIDKALANEPALKKLYDEDKQIRKVVDIARKLEGLARNAGVHAAGVVVADKPMVHFLPLYKSAKQDVITTQFDGPTVEKVGLLKIDFLGLRTLSILERARQLAQRACGRPIDLEGIDLKDSRVYEAFARGETMGVFQFESAGMRDVLRRMKPNRIEDLIAANALYRPGPMTYIDAYVARKHGEQWTTPHPIMTEVLSETYGIMIYQEQVSRLVNRLGNVELKEAFRLAKAISKKKVDKIEAMREPFLEGCGSNGVGRNVANEIFENILKFGGYAFNKAHSTGYALVAYQTAWMKTYFPAEFMAALLTYEMGDVSKVAEYRDTCAQMGIDLEPPMINRSERDFTVERAAEGEAPDAHKRLRFGLGAIKGVGDKAMASVLAAREDGGPFKDIFDFCERVDPSAVNRSVIEALICAGAFDETGAMRKAMIDALDDALSAGHRSQDDRRAGQMTMFGAADAAAPADNNRLSGAEWDEAEMLAREKAVLGFYVTKHPLTTHEALLASCGTATTADLVHYRDGQDVIIGGMVSSLRTVTTKNGRRKGSRLGIVCLEDLHGKIEGILFPDDLDRYRPLLVPDAIVFLVGQVDRKREEPALRISKVVPKDEAVTAFAQGVVLNITTEDALDPIVKLAGRHRGDRALYLQITTREGLRTTVECGRDFKVACDEAFLHAGVDLLGRSAVTVIGSDPKRLAMPWS